MFYWQKCKSLPGEFIAKKRLIPQGLIALIECFANYSHEQPHWLCRKDSSTCTVWPTVISDSKLQGERHDKGESALRQHYLLLLSLLKRVRCLTISFIGCTFALNQVLARVEIIYFKVPSHREVWRQIQSRCKCYFINIIYYYHSEVHDN